MSGADPFFLQFLCAPPGAPVLWTVDLWITGPLLAAMLLYALGATALWRRAGFGRGIKPWQAACFCAGWLVLGLALVSPIHRWGTALFSIHMVEHELVMAVAAPLLAVARPGAALAWACPGRSGRRVGAALRSTGATAAWATVNRPAVATVLHGAAIWMWHAPGLFDAAIDDVALHRLQHVCFFVTGVIFWSALVRRRHPGIAAGHLFVTMLHTGILGALVALAPRVLYRLQTVGAGQWGLTPLEDQQLAGLIMWIPAGLLYAVAALACAGAWVARSSRSAEHGARPREAAV